MAAVWRDIDGRTSNDGDGGGDGDGGDDDDGGYVIDDERTHTQLTNLISTISFIVRLFH